MMDYTINNNQNLVDGDSNGAQHERQEKSNENDAFQVKSSEEKKVQQNKNNFKWTYEEHAKYIYFLELNKIRIKSKLIRKSNAFFKEMERFLQTKTALQCRSHHQKFQERYKFPHRIITGEKKYIPTETYNSVISTVNITDFIIHKQNGENNKIPANTCKEEPINKKEYATISCQTEICNIDKKIYTEEVVKQPALHHYYPPTPEHYFYYHPYLNFY